MRRGETLAAVGRVAVGLAHEIRNPLGAIRGAVQLLKRELGDEARWGEYTDVLLKEVTRVNRIIEMLLDLGRPVTLRPVPLNLHQLLERVALLSRSWRRSAASRSTGATIRACRPSWPTRTACCRSSTISCAMPSRPCPRGGRLTLGHAAVHESALRQGGPRRRPAEHGRGAGGRRGRGHSRGRRAPSSSRPSSPPRNGASAWGWPSATASSRSTGARSRSRASGARHHRLLLRASCAEPIRMGRSVTAATGHDPHRRRRGRTPLGAREGLPRGRLHGHRGEGRHQPRSARQRRSTYDLVLLDIRMPGMDGLTLLRPAARRGAPTPSS